MRNYIAHEVVDRERIPEYLSDIEYNEKAEKYKKSKNTINKINEIKRDLERTKINMQRTNQQD